MTLECRHPRLERAFVGFVPWFYRCIDCGAKFEADLAPWDENKVREQAEYGEKLDSKRDQEPRRPASRPRSAIGAENPRSEDGTGAQKQIAHGPQAGKPR